MRTTHAAFLTEEVAYWYFRLNGCFTIQNFVVHPDYVDANRSQRTDADILAVRFPLRREDPRDAPMRDSDKVRCEEPLLIIAEVKLRTMELNGPWKKRERKNIQRVLRAVGLYSDDEIENVAEALYRRHRFVGSNSEVRMFVLGDEGAEELKQSRPEVFTVQWNEALGFIYDRFDRYRQIKADHKQWGDAGRRLYDAAVNGSDKDTFVESIRNRLEDEQGNPLVG
jgi:hypothetical protein